jgi:aryl-phospho-beta-D-glucosidase BglC (GH1 family)
MNIKTVIFTLFIAFQINFAQSGNFFSTKGNDIIAPDGKSILLKGINLGNWLVPEGYMFKFEKVSSPRLIYDLFNVLLGTSQANIFWNEFRENYITREDIQFIKQSGFNSVRIPFNYKLFVTDYPYSELKGVGYALLDSAVKWCKEENLAIILDMHCAPGGQTGDNIDDSYGYPFLFESKEDTELAIKIWTKLALKYVNETIIIGYDLLNEPIAHYFDKEKLNPFLEPFYKMATESIRKVDPNHLIFLGGAQWDSDFSIFGKPFDDKLVYTFHKYWTPPTAEVIQDYLKYRDKYSVPIWMGESGENTNEWINDFRIVLEKNNIGWCFWPYKKLDSDRGVVSIKTPDNYQLIVKFANSFDVSYGYIRDNKLDYSLIKTICKQYLENTKFKNCIINKNFLKALGL